METVAKETADLALGESGEGEAVSTKKSDLDDKGELIKAATVSDDKIDADDQLADLDSPPKKRKKKNVEEEVEDNDDDEERPSTIASPSSTADSAEQSRPLRSFKRIPIFIVDYHNDVLEFLYRCLATYHLPMKNNILVHFDSHPDLVIADIPASASFDKDLMLGELSIENWIMPTMYVGHFNRVVWLKNSWCQQIQTGKHKFKIGEKDDKIAVDCTLNYFIADGNYCKTDELNSPRDMELQVHNADTDELDPKEFISAEDAQCFILDIDLDFFSTSNPFLEIYKDANCYAQLKEIFHFEEIESTNTNENKDYTSIADRRKKQLDALRRIFFHLEEYRKFDGMETPDITIISNETLAKIHKLAEQLQSKYPDDELDWLLIFDSGCTTDNNGLPHHKSTSEELQEYFGYFQRFLERLPVPPVAITMAHSAQDDYCPQDQVTFIEEQVLRILREVFGERLHEKPIFHYMDDEWDVMKL